LIYFGAKQKEKKGKEKKKDQISEAG